VADVYGASFGGAVVQQFALQSPARLRSMALIATGSEDSRQNSTVQRSSPANRTRFDPAAFGMQTSATRRAPCRVRIKMPVIQTRNFSPSMNNFSKEAEPYELLDFANTFSI
jgi:pimeloyl-ACP methyl ester carboxylesterase